MGGGRAGIAARGSRALGRPGLWRLELCLAAERRPVRVPLVLRDALPGMQLALAEALSLASSLVRGPGLREPPDFPSPPRRSFLHPLSGAAGSLVYSCGASFACSCLPPPMRQPVRGGDPAAGARRPVTSAWSLRASRGDPAEPRIPKRGPRPAMARLAQRRTRCPPSAL